MKVVSEVPTVPGTPYAGGFFAGVVNINGAHFALVVAPKDEGEHEDARWNSKDKSVEGAKSYCDGLANTDAMVKAGSKLAKWARALRIGGFDDWYLPSQDELEICYRALKPTTGENDLYGRSGVNVSSVPTTYPYTTDSPAQTDAKDFQRGGSQAFDSEWYWSSTQHAANSDYAWVQYFGDGCQGNGRKGDDSRARAVRRVAI